jgi:D-amino-acid dehydrogenase
MHVIVIGAGVIGVTTAYDLRQAGCEVTVVERRSGVAQEASFANAGVIAPAYVAPWAQPGMPGKVLSYLFKSEAPVVFRPQLDLVFWRWLQRWLRECELSRFQANKRRMQRVAFYSRVQLHELRSRLSLNYEQAQGYLQLLRTARDLERAAPALQVLADAGVAHRLIDAAECRRLEPALHAGTELAAGIHLPDDETGNCAYFARQLKEICERDGVRFRFGVPVAAVNVSANRVRSIATREGAIECDAVVVAAGVDSAAIAASCGVNLPLYPIKGFSATVTIERDHDAPQLSVMDEAYKVAITRMGHRLRVAGTAEFGSRKLELRASALATLLKVARDWFPAAATWSRARYWAGARPMLPDGPPVLGATAISGLYLNVGHGSTGWAMACGSARVVADLVLGRTPEIDLEGLTLQRFAGWRG